jgi:putative hemolysin
MKLTHFGLAAVATVLVFAPGAEAAVAFNPAKAAAYCVEHGGVVQTRIPEYNTNGGTPLVLSGGANFCQFTSKKDGSQINVLLSTLFARQPSLAALAYYAQVQLGQCNGNPASCYCTLLGGTDLFGGINAAGGGWVLRSDLNDVLEACIFPDLSSIDSWGLAYHSAGIVRGKDLAKVLRYPSPYSGTAAAGPGDLPFAPSTTAR